MQVEYAMEAINKAGAAIGIKTDHGIILATEKQTASALLEQCKDLSALFKFAAKESEKIFALDKHLYCVVSGVTADANYLIEYARYLS
jgi:20S proteasome subunit alpha 3